MDHPLPLPTLPSVLRRSARACLAVTALVASGMVSAQAASAARRADLPPNVLLIVVDDLGYGELGSYGGREIPTPNIDALARGGVRFTQGYVTASFCAPSRAGLLTGRYQTRFGFEGNPVGARNDEPGVGLPLSERTLADTLRDGGYVTGLVGKWHLGATAPFHPLRRGFDEFFGFLHEGHYFVPHPWKGATTWLRRRALPDGGQGRWTSPDGSVIWTTHMGHKEPDYNANNPILRNSQPAHESANLTDAFTREGIDFVRRHASQPFFLYLAYNAVHSPLQADNAWLAKFSHIPDIQRRIFAAMLGQLDANIGRLLAALDETRLSDRTLVVFLSDNGGATRELTSRNTPLRGGKGDVWEGGVRVPFLMRWPQRLPAGSTFTHPVSALDIFTSAVAATGGQAKAPGPRDGVNLLPYLTGEKTGAPRDTLYWRMGPKMALRQGDWKIVQMPASRGETTDWQLFNLAQDISESRNLAAEQPARLAELKAAWDALNGEMMPSAN